MSGSKIPAEQGALTFLIGGDKAILKDEGVQADLAAMGKASYMLGKVGAGTRMKLVVYMVKGEMMASLAEGLALAGAAGLEQKAMLEILGQWVGGLAKLFATLLRLPTTSYNFHLLYMYFLCLRASPARGWTL